MPLPTVRAQVKGDLRPIGTNVVIKKIPPPEETKGGIILPNKFQTGLGRGTVTHLGTGIAKKFPEHKLVIGEVVYFPIQLSYPKVNLNGDELSIVPIAQIYGVER